MFVKHNKESTREKSRTHKNGILFPEHLASGCHFVFLSLGICVDFQKCVDFWFRLKKCVDLRRYFRFVCLYQSRQGFFEDARRECHSPVLLVEQRIDASEYVDGCFGTADMVIITDKVAHVIDLKLGKGVEVHAEENPQLMIYGLGVLHMAEALYDIETVRMTIFQPRLGNSSTWSVSPEYLKRWGNEVLRPAGAQALIGAGDFSAGTWCRFCRARNQCRARAESYLALAKMDFRQPALLSDAEISEIIGKADELSKWATDVYAFAQDEAVNHGKAWPGFKVVEGRSIRKYTDEADVVQAAIAAGYKDIYKKTLIGIGEMEKLMGKEQFRSILGQYVTKPHGKLTLVPESDRREAVTASTAQDDFMEV